MKRGLLLLVTLTACTVVQPPKFAPDLKISPSDETIGSLSSPFHTEQVTVPTSRVLEELKIGETFARDGDYYRAITAFKSGLALLPDGSELARKQQLQYDTILAYYLGERYEEAISFFERSDLTGARPDFPAYRNMLILLHDSYYRLENETRTAKILTLSEKQSPELASDLQLSWALRHGDVDTARKLGNGSIDDALDRYENRRKSVNTAGVLNALLPGAGYWYVGQRQTALTALLINAAFTGAAVYFFQEGNIGAGVVTASLEMGWYIGGIDGARRAANQYNEKVYAETGHQLLSQEKLYPVLMFTHGF